MNEYVQNDYGELTLEEMKEGDEETLAKEAADVREAIANFKERLEKAQKYLSRLNDVRHSRGFKWQG